MRMRKPGRKKVIAVAIALLALALVVVRCTAIHASAPDDGVAIEEDVDSSAVDATELTTEGEEREIPLTERQKQLIDSYDAATTDFIEFLRANSWQTSDSLRTVQFSETTYVETDLASENVSDEITYAISAKNTSVQTSPDATTELTTVVLECGDGKTRLMTLGKTTELDGTIRYVLSSQDFSVASSYLRYDRAENVEVDGMTETMKSYIGNDTVGLEHVLTEYCAKFCPSAQRAIWEQIVTLDDASGTVSFSVMLDAADIPSVAVLYNRADGTFEVGRQR